MKRTCTFLTLLFFFALCSLQCHKENNPTAPPDAGVDLRKIIPLRPGNSWQYRCVSMGLGFPMDTTFDTVQIVDTVRINGQKYFKFHGTPPHFPVDSNGTFLETISSTDYSVYTWVDGNRAVQRSSESKSGKWLPLHVLRTPLVNGHQWPCTDWSSDYGTITIIDTDATLISDYTDDTIYHAIHVASSWGLTYDIVPGIGIVHQFNGGFDWATWKELMTYHLN